MSLLRPQVGRRCSTSVERLAGQAMGVDLKMSSLLIFSISSLAALTILTRYLNNHVHDTCKGPATIFLALAILIRVFNYGQEQDAPELLAHLKKGRKEGAKKDSKMSDKEKRKDALSKARKHGREEKERLNAFRYNTNNVIS